jgi:hypothetical protein
MTSVIPCPNNWSETTKPKCPGKGNANNCRWYKEKIIFTCIRIRVVNGPVGIRLNIQSELKPEFKFEHFYEITVKVLIWTWAR